jgi:outer membrane protein assembly factor BamD (BamD/ComL family)
VNPNDLRGAAQRYEMVRTLFPDTFQEKIAKKALRRLYFRKRQTQISGDEWEATVIRAQESVDNLKFGSAIVSINAFQKKYPDSRQSRLVGQHVVQVERLAEETFKRFIEKAETFRAEGSAEEASAIYMKIIAHWGLDRFVQKAKEDLGELERGQNGTATSK